MEEKIMIYEFGFNFSLIKNIIWIVAAILLLIYLIGEFFHINEAKKGKKFFKRIAYIIGFCLCLYYINSFCGYVILYFQKYPEYKERLNNGEYQIVEGIASDVYLNTGEGQFQVEDTLFSYSSGTPILGYNGACSKLKISNGQKLRVRYIDDYDLLDEGYFDSDLTTTEPLSHYRVILSVEVIEE
jgi:hypothetical protein